MVVATVPTSADPIVVEAAKGVVLNPGTRPAVPSLPGIEGTPFWTNRDAVQVTDAAGVPGGARRRPDRL